jgi:hypothetical protein
MLMRMTWKASCLPTSTTFLSLLLLISTTLPLFSLHWRLALLLPYTQMSPLTTLFLKMMLKSMLAELPSPNILVAQLFLLILILSFLSSWLKPAASLMHPAASLLPLSQLLRLQPPPFRPLLPSLPLRLMSL